MRCSNADFPRLSPSRPPQAREGGYPTIRRPDYDPVPLSETELETIGDFLRHLSAWEPALKDVWSEGFAGLRPEQMSLLLRDAHVRLVSQATHPVFPIVRLLILLYHADEENEGMITVDFQLKIELTIVNVFCCILYLVECNRTIVAIPSLVYLVKYHRLCGCADPRVPGAAQTEDCLSAFFFVRVSFLNGF